MRLSSREIQRPCTKISSEGRLRIKTGWCVSSRVAQDGGGMPRRVGFTEKQRGPSPVSLLRFGRTRASLSPRTSFSRRAQMPRYTPPRSSWKAGPTAQPAWCFECRSQPRVWGMDGFAMRIQPRMAVSSRSPLKRGSKHHKSSAASA